MTTELLSDRPVRDWRGRFARLVCVNAHDRCYGGAGGDCPYCETRVTPKEKRDG